MLGSQRYLSQIIDLSHAKHFRGCLPNSHSALTSLRAPAEIKEVKPSKPLRTALFCNRGGQSVVVPGAGFEPAASGPIAFQIMSFVP
jgi:hypothetical protein